MARAVNDEGDTRERWFAHASMHRLESCNDSSNGDSSVGVAPAAYQPSSGLEFDYSQLILQEIRIRESL